MIVERYAPFIRKIISLCSYLAGMFIKRLKFVGNRHVSQGVRCSFSLCGMVFTLDTTSAFYGIYSDEHGKRCEFWILFLLSGARWSYYVKTNICGIISFGKMFSKNPAIQRWHMSPVGFWVDVVLLKIIVTIFLRLLYLAICLLKLKVWWSALQRIVFHRLSLFSGCGLSMPPL